MSFDSDQAVGAICDAAEALIKMRRVRARVKIDVRAEGVNVTCRPALKAASDAAKHGFDRLIDLVSHDNIGYGEGGPYELLVRGILQVIISEHAFLSLVTPQYGDVPWCLDAQPMLKVLSLAADQAAAMLLRSRIEARDQCVQTSVRIKRETAFSAFCHLQQHGDSRLGDWFLEGQTISTVPVIVRSCERLWLVFNISNDFDIANLRQRLR